MKELPIGQQNFENLMRDNGVYVDKTAYIHQMTSGAGRYYFLSRPRRFGKSLLLSTIQAAFEGKKELFEGLYIYDKLDWNEKHPVILLDMSLQAKSLTSLKEGIISQLSVFIKRYNLDIQYKEPAIIFSELFRLLYQKTGKQVVVLIDEYDKPILDTIEDLEKANEIRSFLQSFYAVLKSSGIHLRFVLLTGVSKISQTSIFSGLNNLNDITLNEKYAGICGYTQQELENDFSEYILDLSAKYEMPSSEMLQKIKYWYNGYSWDGQTFVYNPFSVLLLFDNATFDAHWFNTGTPAFLIKLLQQKNDFSPVLEEKIIVSRGFDSKQTLEKMDVVSLCFQTGYLTIKKSSFKDSTLELQIPNEEVRKALMDALMHSFTNLRDTELLIISKKLYSAFENGDVPTAVEYLQIVFSNAGYHEGINTEGYYHNLFEIIAKFSRIDILTESRTDIGRVDCVLKFTDRTYVIEIKCSANVNGLSKAAEAALRQIREKRYYQPWLHQGKEVRLLELGFTKGGIEWREEVM